MSFASAALGLLFRPSNTRLFVEACMDGDTKVVRKMLRKKQDPNLVDKDGFTPLQYAACNGHLAVIELLVAAGADVRVKDRNSRSLLHFACFNGHLKIARYLFEQGLALDAMDNDDFSAGKRGKSLLHYACAHGHLGTAALLIKHMPELLNKKDRFGNTPLHYITCYEEETVGDRPEMGQRTQMGMPSTQTTWIPPVQTKGYLGDIDESDENLEELDEDVRGRFRRTGELLINAGANLDAKNNAGKTPVDYAKPQMASFLLVVRDDFESRKQEDEVLEETAPAEMEEEVEVEPEDRSARKEVTAKEEGERRVVDVKEERKDHSRRSHRTHRKRHHHHDREKGSPRGTREVVARSSHSSGVSPPVQNSSPNVAQEVVKAPEEPAEPPPAAAVRKSKSERKKEKKEKIQLAEVEWQEVPETPNLSDADTEPLEHSVDSMSKSSSSSAGWKDA